MLLLFAGAFQAGSAPSHPVSSVSPTFFTVPKGWKTCHSAIKPNCLQHPWMSDALESLVWPYCSNPGCVAPVWFLQRRMEIPKHKDVFGEGSRPCWGFLVQDSSLLQSLWLFVCCWLFLQIAAEPEIRMLLIKTCWDGDRMCLPDVSKIGNLPSTATLWLGDGKIMHWLLRNCHIFFSL